MGMLFGLTSISQRERKAVVVNGGESPKDRYGREQIV